MKAIFVLPPHLSDYNTWKHPTWEICRIPPVGLMYIISYLNSKKHEAHLFDSRMIINQYKTNEYIEILINFVEKENPDFIGINILTALFGESRKIISAIRIKFPDLLIIAGGPHPSVEPDITLSQIPELDAVCIGAGEEVCLDILEGQNIKDIPGLMVQGNNEKYIPRNAITDIDNYPFYYNNHETVKYYTALSGKTTFGWLSKSLSVLSSRSCPFSCKFCASDWSKPFLMHSSEYILELVKYLSRFDIDVIAFWDDTIGANEKRLKDICEKFIKAKLFFPHGRLRWRASLRANQINKDLLELMKKAGCYHIAVGMESGSDRILQHMDKKTTVEMNQQACSYVSESGIDLGVSFMIGSPTETLEEVQQTFSFIKNLQCNTIGCGNFRPLPGSPYYDDFVKKGILIKTDLDWDNLGNFSVAPDKLYCQYDRVTYEHCWEEAQKIAYGNQYIAVHEEIALKYQNIIKDSKYSTIFQIKKNN